MENPTDLNCSTELVLRLSCVSNAGPALMTCGLRFCQRWTKCGPYVHTPRLMAPLHLLYTQCFPQPSIQEYGSRCNQVMIFVLLLSDLEVCVYFGDVQKLAAPLLVRTSFTDGFFKSTFPMERQNVPIRSCPVVIQYYLRLHSTAGPWAVILNNFWHWEDTNDQVDNNNRTSLFQVEKCVTISSNTYVTAPVTTNSARLIYMVPHLNPVRNGMYLPASWISSALLHVPLQIFCQILRNFR